MREGPTFAGPRFRRVVVFPVCVQEIWCQIVRFSRMKLCSRSVRTLGEQALGIKKELFLNGRRRGDMEDDLQIYMPAGCGLPKLPPCSGSGIERRDINFQTHVNCWTLHCSCDKGWLFKSEHPMLKSVTLKVSSDQ